MKLDGVDTWLQHWLKLQKNKKWPLVLKDPVDKAAKRKTTPTVVIKPKGKKAGYVKRDLDEVSQSDREADGGSDKVAHFTIINHNRINNNAEGGIVYCPTYTTITSKCSQIPEQSLYIPCITFWKCKLQEAITPSLCGQSLTILGTCRTWSVSRMANLQWAMWQWKVNHLPEAFYSTKSSLSPSAIKQWVMKDPITSADDRLASYQQVEPVVLSIGPAL